MGAACAASPSTPSPSRRAASLYFILYTLYYILYTLYFILYTRSTGGIINPLTASGTILAATDGAAVLASAYPDWIATFMLGLNYYPLPYSLSSMISYVLPGLTQEFYDAKLEDF